MSVPSGGVSPSAEESVRHVPASSTKSCMLSLIQSESAATTASGSFPTFLQYLQSQLR